LHQLNDNDPAILDYMCTAIKSQSSKSNAIREIVFKFVVGVFDLLFLLTAQQICGAHEDDIRIGTRKT
jgi:hypothetical protein